MGGGQRGRQVSFLRFGGLETQNPLFLMPPPKKTKKQTRTQFKLVIPHCKKHHTVMNKSHFSFTGVSYNLSTFSLHCSIPEGVFVFLTFEFAALQQSSGLLQREKFLDGDKVVVHT